MNEDMMETAKNPKKPPDSVWKIDRCKKKLKKPSSIKVGEHIPCAIQCLRYGHLMVQKISMMYTEVKIA